jgi:dephospho-CoA kinase
VSDEGSAARNSSALRVGLTGGIASGKSLVANMFAKLGPEIVDADRVAREVVAPGEPVLAALREAFGAEVLSSRGELDRAALRKLVFADAEKRRTLDALLHPLIRARLLARLDQVRGPYAIIAVPLLVETDFAALVDRIAVVDCPESVQLERLMRRDGIPRTEAVAMIAAQADRATRLRAAHDVIDNSGDVEATRRQVALLHHRYLDLANRATRATT